MFAYSGNILIGNVEALLDVLDGCMVLGRLLCDENEPRGGDLDRAPACPSELRIPATTHSEKRSSAPRLRLVALRLLRQAHQMHDETTSASHSSSAALDPMATVELARLLSQQNSFTHCSDFRAGSFAETRQMGLAPTRPLAYA